MFQLKTLILAPSRHIGKTALQLAARKLDGFVVPREDEYQGEYVPACNERLSFLTGFGGSAAVAGQ